MQQLGNMQRKLQHGIARAVSIVSAYSIPRCLLECQYSESTVYSSGQRKAKQSGMKSLRWDAHEAAVLQFTTAVCKSPCHIHQVL